MDIHGVPKVAHETPEHPPPGDLHGGAEGHGEQGNQEVGEGLEHQLMSIANPFPNTNTHSLAKIVHLTF